MEILAKKYLFWIFLIIFAISFFGQKNIRTIKDIDLAVLENPTQTKILQPEIIEFKSNGYAYRITPLYNYILKGLVVSKFTYDIFNVYKYGGVFPVDLCMIWGGNVKNGAHINKDVNFSQDCRWCHVQWYGNVAFDFNEMSNNHLVVKDARIRRIVNSISAGDQVYIKGKLVNVKAVLLKSTGSFDPQEFEWKTSTTREDGGAGACEVIYVEDIRILKKGNLFFYWLFLLSFYGLLALVIYKIGFFIYETKAG
ncbi:MAG: hypothetical protein PHT53_02860 [Candidatus Omnitrophica bacterium]|nr:hypothetical protein [Candidatus Omnitrophota bacterium]